MDENFPSKAQLVDLKIKCSKCNFMFPIKWHQIEEYINAICPCCQQSILVTEKDYESMKQLESDVMESDDDELDEFMDTSLDVFGEVKANFETNGEGKVDIIVDYVEKPEDSCAYSKENEDNTA